jgi:hypothetical protein
MRQLKYNFATNTLRLEFPDEWEPADISGITLAIHDRDGTELYAATSVTIYTATTLDDDVEAYLSEFVLASGAGAVSPGDILWIDGVAGPERQTVKGYDSTTRTVTVESILDNAHEDGDAVYPCWGTSGSIDTTTVATWTAGLPVTLTWTPTGSGQAFKELAEVSKISLAVEGLERRFEAIYGRAYDDLRTPADKFGIFREESERQLRLELSSNGLDMDRIMDNDVIAPVLMAKMAFLWTLNGDENKTDERQAISSEYEALLAQLLKNPIWTDVDQDGIQDTDEVTDHDPIFLPAW